MHRRSGLSDRRGTGSSIGRSEKEPQLVEERQIESMTSSASTARTDATVLESKFDSPPTVEEKVSDDEAPPYVGITVERIDGPGVVQRRESDHR